MTEHVAFLMKDLVLLAVSVYLLRQDVMRASLAAGNPRLGQAAVATGTGAAQRHASHT